MFTAREDRFQRKRACCGREKKVLRHEHTLQINVHVMFHIFKEQQKLNFPNTHSVSMACTTIGALAA
jgi:hypothetical protein